MTVGQATDAFLLSCSALLVAWYAYFRSVG